MTNTRTLKSRNTNESLRKSIIAEMQRHELKINKELGDHSNRNRYYSYCTWWFKLHIDCTTAEARSELNRMQKDGLVTSDKSQRNNTKWLLVKEVGNE